MSLNGITGPARRATGPGIGEIRERHKKAYDLWTPEADAELLASYLAGRAVAQLAADFERQPNAIVRRLEKLAFAELTARRARQGDAAPA
jgi:hypothetical protein